MDKERAAAGNTCDGVENTDVRAAIEIINTHTQTINRKKAITNTQKHI